MSSTRKPSKKDCKCVEVDPVYQSVFDELIKAFNNIGYGTFDIQYCPCCGHNVELGGN